MLSVVVILLAKWGLMTLVPYDAVATYGAQGAADGSPAGPGTWQHFHGVKGWVNAMLGWFGAAQQFLPAAAIAMFGGWGSEWLITRGQALKKSLLLSLAGTSIAAIAIAMAYGYQATGDGLLGDYTVPASKWFFSVPYCLLSAGVGLVLYAAFWLVCDGWKLTGLLPLRVFGLNAIVLYVGSGLTFNVIVARWTTHRPDGETASLAASLVAWTNHLSGTTWLGPYLWPTLWLSLWWLICWWMYRRKLFVRV